MAVEISVGWYTDAYRGGLHANSFTDRRDGTHPDQFPALADCIGSGRHDPAVLRYICQSERAWSNSVANGDTAVPNRILADDYSGVGWSREFYGKAEMAAMASKTSRTVASQDQEEAHVRFYGNTAVAQGADKFRTKNGAVSRIVWTDVWLKRHGKWQIIASQELPLRASQEAPLR